MPALVIIPEPCGGVCKPESVELTNVKIHKPIITISKISVKLGLRKGLREKAWLRRLRNLRIQFWVATKMTPGG